ncbi:ankyrin repeat domain-containing protein 39 isoform X1 [Columba livia]|uniref:ankyrin repeat domain-containing protein 39 isoform X1 n=1 Tax=Columba livia TaxID=8932 RepID=UPI0031B9EE86
MHPIARGVGRFGSFRLHSALPGFPQLPSALPGFSRLPSALPGSPRLPSALSGFSRLPSALPGSPRLPSALSGFSRLPSALPGSPRLLSALSGSLRPFLVGAMAAGRRSPPGPCCPSRLAVPSVHQSLPEMDFERGIWAAARDGDEPRVLELLERRGEPSQPDLAGYTALHYASRNGHLGVCRLLLQRGARCDARTPGGATPLHRASYCGHLPIAQLLLAHGADPLATDGDGRTSLHKVGGTAGMSPPGLAPAFAHPGDDRCVTHRPLSKATGSSVPCSCSTARRWLASATPRAGVPATWPPQRCGTCWTPDGDTQCHWTTSAMDKHSP